MTHLERRHSIEIAASAERVFPLFTPLGERAWVDGWDPEFLHPADGETCAGMVFRTGGGAEATLWACADWEPAAYRVRYVRVTPGSRLGFVTVACRPLDPERTEATVTYAFTALSDAGRDYLDGFGETAFAAMIEGWRGAIERLLATGHRQAP